MKNALWSGICVGLAAACKYPGVLAVAPLIVACLYAKPDLRQRELWLGLGCSALAFFIASPYVLLDWSAAYISLASMGSEHLLSDSHQGERFALWHHLRYNVRFGVGLLGVAGALGGLGMHWRKFGGAEWVVWSGLAMQLIFLSASSSVFMRYALPLAPFVVIGWCRGLSFIARSGWVYGAALLINPLARIFARVLPGQ